MAGAIYVPLKTVFNDAGLKQAQKSIGGLAKSLKGTLAGLGVATSFGAVVSQLEQAAKAAVADTKAQALLAQQMRNTVGANDNQIASTEAFIQKLQLQTSILDDQLRPAMSSLIRATGDVAKAQDLLTVATNVSAATGKDLESVALALGKAYSGQTTALFRMIPGLKGSADWLAKLKTNVDGAAVAAANTDPFTKMNVAFNNMQEAIGMALIPSLQSLASYVTGAEFQNGFKNAVEQFTYFIGGLTAIGDAIVVLDRQLDRFNESIGMPNIDLSWIDYALRKFIPLYNLIAGVIGLGKSEAEKAKLNAGSGVNTNSLEGILKASGNLKTYVPEVTKTTGATKKLATENKALTDAVAKAKAAFDAKVKAYQDAVKAAQDIIDSTKEMTASFVQLFKVTPKMGEFETKTVDAFTSIYDTIKSSLADNRILKSAADALTKYADSTLATLRSYAKQQDVLAGKIDVARTITSGVMGLADITSFLQTTTESVTTSVTSYANGIQTIITKTADVTKTSGLVDNFQKVVDKTKAFAKNLIDLRKLGLNKNLFAQLVNAGADAGGATAQAIVDGGSDTIKALNDLYGQLDTAAAEIAQTSTDTLYEVGQQVVTNGFIEGLVSQSDALAAAAEAMANSFATAFNSQLAAALQANLPAAPMANDGTGLPGDPYLNRPSPTRSPQRYAAWLAGVGGIDKLRSPQRYEAQQKTYNVTLNTGIVTSPAGLGAEIVSAISAYERASGAVYASAS